jgi:carbonic anhydrase
VLAAESHDPAPGGVDAAAIEQRLSTGNAAFIAGGGAVAAVDAARRAAIANGQTPWCTVLTCADSRMPPEHIFHAGLGELFTVRVAGNVADPVTVGSIEYAAEHLGTPLVVVMGHERCGAVKAAQGTASLGPNLDTLLGLIRPHIHGLSDLDSAVLANARAQVAELQKSEILSHLEEEGKLSIVPAYYDLDSGAVRFLDPVAGQASAHEH